MEDTKKRMQRAGGRAARKAVSSGNRRFADTAICNGIAASEAFLGANVIMAYCHFDGEPDVSALIAEAVRLEKTVVYPYCIDSVQMLALQPESPEAMQADRFDIVAPDPAHARECDPARIGLVLVPCAAFDERGYRVGMGAGYYDRFLPMCENAVACIVAYEAQRVDAAANEPHDVPCDVIATEQGFYVVHGNDRRAESRLQPDVATQK